MPLRNTPMLRAEERQDWGWEPGLADLLADPIIRLLMQRDGVSEQDVQDQRWKTHPFHPRVD